MGKPGIGNREESSLKITPRPFWTFGSQSEGTKKTVDSTNTPEKLNFFDCDLGAEMNPLIAVKDDLACRDKSKVIAYLAFFGLSRF